MPHVGKAPGKLILFGEHAVVYGRPAIAVPLESLGAVVNSYAGAVGAGLRIVAEDLGKTFRPEDDHPLALMARLTLDLLGERQPDVILKIRSTLPIAGGLGSGAAVSAALGRELAAVLGGTISNERLNALVYEVEKMHHGTPSGIDNTVVVYGEPVYFVREFPAAQSPTGRAGAIQRFPIGAPFSLAIADTGIPSPTAEVVGDVRVLYEGDRARWAAVFDMIGRISDEARAHIAMGRVHELGGLMNRNHALLQVLTVSSPALDTLVKAARDAGAPGAKLSGAGRGGNVIALAEGIDRDHLENALLEAGAVRVIFTTVR